MAYILVISAVGGGIVAQTLVDRVKRALLIERGKTQVQPHWLNASCQFGGSEVLQDSDVDYCSLSALVRCLP